ncbi:hypothetical protein F895_01745 [Acinetobacter sp. CIP 64.2]|uniref:helix-turn-helix domain-containing protein n=1 Tax=unclassified Acinetobacter TaxID=196816 RepID=UPI0002892094|nr:MULTISPECIES: helix-turn-helix domain-containing protein [unclassified Acinetobacter]ENX16154.1 hypothetical protein F895_01745 [Acinetobacter sp. CIP 64.2]
MENFAQRLKFFRTRAGLNQRDLADIVGISQKQISDYEVGLSKPRPNTYIKLLETLGVDETTFVSTIIPDSNEPIKLKILNRPAGEYIYLPYWIKDVLMGTVDDLEALVFCSNALTPYLNKNDIMVIDKANRHLENGSIYAFDMSKSLAIRIVQTKILGGVELSATDPKILNENFDNDKLPVYGKVIYRQGLM